MKQKDKAIKESRKVTIDSGIKLPPRKTGTGQPPKKEYYIFKKMRVGDSVYIPTLLEKTKFYSMVIRRFGYGCIETRKEGRGYRIWKVKHRSDSRYRGSK